MLIHKDKEMSVTDDSERIRGTGIADFKLKSEIILMKHNMVIYMSAYVFVTLYNIVVLI